LNIKFLSVRELSERKGGGTPLKKWVQSENEKITKKNGGLTIKAPRQEYMETLKGWEYRGVGTPRQDEMCNRGRLHTRKGP